MGEVGLAEAADPDPEAVDPERVGEDARDPEPLDTGGTLAADPDGLREPDVGPSGALTADAEGLREAVVGPSGTLGVDQDGLTWAAVGLEGDSTCKPYRISTHPSPTHCAAGR